MGLSSMCSGCKGNKIAVSHSVASRASTDQQQVAVLPDEEMVLITYLSANRGNHPVYGAAINPMTNKKFFYGYRAGGSQFLVHRDDVYAVNRHGQPVLRAPNKFRPVSQPARVEVPQVAPKAPPPPRAVTQEVVKRAEPSLPTREEAESPPRFVEGAKPFNFQTLPGVTPAIARELEAMGLRGPDDVLALGIEGLQKVRGIGETKARKIIEYLNR